MKRSDFVDSDGEVRFVIGGRHHWITPDHLKLGDVIDQLGTGYHWTVTELWPTHFTVTRNNMDFTFPIHKDGSPMTPSPDEPKQASPVTDCSAHIKHQCYREIITAIRAVYDDVCTWPKDCQSHHAFMVEIQAAIMELILGECSDE